MKQNPRYEGLFYTILHKRDCWNCQFYGVARCLLFRGFLRIGEMIRTIRSVCYVVGVCYSGVSANRGSTVLLNFMRLLFFLLSVSR